MSALFAGLIASISNADLSAVVEGSFPVCVFLCCEEWTRCPRAPPALCTPAHAPGIAELPGACSMGQTLCEDLLQLLV